jgi:hypothetical protein
MWVIREPILSPTGDRIVGKRQTGARAEILGDPHRRIWEQHDESLEAFEKRVGAEADALHQTSDLLTSARLLRLPQQLRQLGDIRRDPPRLILW